MTEHLLLIDASGFAHRAYHVGATRFRSDGLPTWAIEGFMGMTWRLLGAVMHDQPTMAAAVFDWPARTFRHTLFPDYKNNRPARDEELKAQLPFMRHAADTMGITSVEHEGFEADDVIATLATRAAAENIRTTIVSSDKDFQQLVRKDLIEIVDPVAHMRIEERDVRGVLQFRVEPHQVPDVQALCGDSVDNIPGLDGIGHKSARAMIRRWGSVEGVVAAAKNVNEAFHLQPRQRLELKKPDALARLQLYRTLATLRRDVPLDTSWQLLELRPILRDHVEKLLKVLEASGRFEAIFTQSPKMQRVVEAMNPHSQFEWWEEELAVPGQELWDVPQCGFYQRRLVKGGVFVPARIWREPALDPVTGEPTGEDILRCELGEEPRDPVLEWDRLAKNPISREKYQFEMADRTWARQYAPGDPKANPTKPVDFGNLKPPVFNQPVRQKRKKNR